MGKKTTSLNISYEPIPDLDELGDIKDHPTTDDHNNSHAQSFLSKSKRRMISLVVGVFIVGGVVYSYFMSQRDAYLHKVIKESNRNPVSVFQTSMIFFNEDRLKQMKIEDYEDRGLSFSSWSFSFTTASPCNGIDSMEELNVNGDCAIDLTPDIAQGLLLINTSRTYQEIIGFGGAFTEASAHNYNKLSTSAKDQLIDAYFGEEGIRYVLGRVSIGSCDFSLSSYNFDDIKDDFMMRHFDHNVTHDQQEIIPFLRAAFARSSATHLPLQLIAAPWSPPAWMKVDAADMTGSHWPNGLKASPDVMRAWALYFSYFIDAYDSAGVPIWAVTPQNEPEFPAPWEACAYNASFERAFIDDFLGPQLRKTHPEIKILAFDHNKDHLVNWTKAMMSPGPGGAEGGYAMSPFVDGMAFHWYAGGDDRLRDGTYGYDAVQEAHFLMKNAETWSSSADAGSDQKHVRSSETDDDIVANKILLATEACSCPGVRLDSWFRAERLGHDIMFDLNNYAQGWIDWNLLLDFNGGPNHLGNDCDAPVIASRDFTTLIFQPEFYYIGHFSKFIPPQSVRVESAIVGNFNFQTDVHPDIHEGIELGVFPCEHSSRQMWKWRISPKNENFGYIQLLVSVLYDENVGTDTATLPVDSSGSSTTPATGRQLHGPGDDEGVYRCVGMGDDNRPFLRLWDCFPPVMDTPDDSNNKEDIDEAVAAILNSRRLSLQMERVFIETKEDNIFRFIQESTSSNNKTKVADSSESRLCVTVNPPAGSAFSGIDLKGALLTLDRCTDLHGERLRDFLKHPKLIHQLWKWDKSTGEVVPFLSLAESSIMLGEHQEENHHPLCLTAGWPYLSAAAFVTPSRQTVVTIMNEYPKETYVLLQDKAKGSMWSALNGKSIQTVTF